VSPAIGPGNVAKMSKTLLSIKDGQPGGTVHNLFTGKSATGYRKCSNLFGIESDELIFLVKGE
jgi:hypothetical protein